MRRTARTRPATHPERKPHTYKGRLVVLVLAGVLSLLAGWQAWQLWSGLPGVQLWRLTRADYDRAQREAEAHMSRAARQGLIAANVSHLFTAALQSPDVYPAALDTLQRMLSELQDTQLGRLQLAAFLMLEMERAGTPMEQWWPRLEPVLRGLERAEFPHFLSALEDNRTEMYQSLGLRSGAARAQAEGVIGQPHGPLLEYLAPRLAKLAQARASSDGSEVLCRRVLLKLLRVWTLDDGPPGMRLLAADLLVQTIAAGNLVPREPASGGHVAEQLRQWRAAYRAFAAAHRSLPYPVSVGEVPDLRPELSWQLATALPLWMWLLGALFAAALVSMASLLLARGAFVRVSGRLSDCILVVSTATVLMLAAFAWTRLGSASVLDDVCRLAPQTGGLPRTPVMAFSLLALLLPMTALLRPAPGAPRRARAARVAVVAVWTLLLLGLYCLPFWDWISPGHTEFCPRGDRIALATGQHHVHLLDGLRAWQP